MAYFANGSEAAIYQGRYCERCANYRDRGDGRGHGCAVFDLHFLWSYESRGDEPEAKIKREALDLLIPEKGIVPQECSMFLPENED